MRHVKVQAQPQISIVDLIIRIYKGSEPPTKYGVKRLIRQNVFKLNDQPVTINTLVDLSSGKSYLIEKTTTADNLVMVEVNG